MKYNYYKDKYRTVSIKLDKQLDRDIIEYLDSRDGGPKNIICHAIRELIMQQAVLEAFISNGIFKFEDDVKEGES